MSSGQSRHHGEGQHPTAEHNEGTLPAELLHLYSSVCMLHWRSEFFAYIHMDMLHISDSGVNSVKRQREGANWVKGLPAMCVPIVLRLSQWQGKNKQNKYKSMLNDTFNTSAKPNRKVIFNLKIRPFYLRHSFCTFDSIGCLINNDCSV